MKLIQVSDLHFVPLGTRLFGLDPRARLEAAIADINRHHGDAELCVFTGDLADQGAPAAYDALRQTLAALQIPYQLTIGNHDDRNAFLHAFPEAPRDEHGFVQSVVSTGAGHIIVLDTNEPGQESGFYCTQHQAWLKERLKAAAGGPDYLFMHHPPLDIGIPSMDSIGLVEKKGFSEAVAGTADIRHIFFGHVHRPVSGSWRGIPYSALFSLVHQVTLDFVSERLAFNSAPPAYNVILLDGEDTVVHHHEFLDASRLPPGQACYTKAP